MIILEILCILTVADSVAALLVAGVLAGLARHEERIAALAARVVVLETKAKQ